jgi:hypothetical protein
LGINLSQQTKGNFDRLYGWDSVNKIHLQHATPQELIDSGKLTWEQWNDYYKFIIVRNPWSRALSDYLWIIKGRTIIDSFCNFLNKTGDFYEILNRTKISAYRGDHLKKQKDYFYYNDKKLEYNLIIRFENIEDGLKLLKKDLNLATLFFSYKANVGQKKYKHYSHFYNSKRKKLVEKKYNEDIKFFEYKFEDTKKGIEIVQSEFPSIFHIPKNHWIKYYKKKIKKTKFYKLVK